MKQHTARTTLTTDDGARLAVYTVGAPSAPVTVILSHGYLMTADTWRIQTRELVNRGYRVVRYDQRAHGNSAGGQAFTIDRLGRDLAQVIATTAADGPMVLGAHSMGGMAAMAAAAVQPHIFARRETRVALISTSCSKAIFKPSNRPAHWGKGASRAGFASSVCWRPSVTDALRRRLPKGNPWALRPDEDRNEGAPPPNREAIHHTRTEQIAQLWTSLRSFDATGKLDALHRLGDRVEIATGALDDWIPLTQIRLLAAQLPLACTHEPIPGARHRLPTDRNGSSAVTRMLIQMCEAIPHQAIPVDAGQNARTR
ncbi:alpha/beta fold hydrolase (plasmid) [Streptomyces sp. NBC_00445]|uniref:alpha/beta fold hydrolase n=1 Tax=Streptomyces sp. NBC_00445 TaxID=2975745 RepID=UPI002E200E89